MAAISEGKNAIKARVGMFMAIRPEGRAISKVIIR